MSRRRRRRLAVVIALLLVAALTIVTFKVIRNAQQHRLLVEARAQGLSAYQRGEFETTLNNLSYFFEHVKDDLQVNLAFADARARTPAPGGRHLLEAVDLYSTHGLRLIESEPQIDRDGTQRKEILHHLLQLYSQLGLRLEIIETADRLLQAEPKSKEALLAKMTALCLQGKYLEAQPVAAELIKLDPANIAWRRSMLDIERECGMSADQQIEQSKQWAQEFEGDGRFHLLTAALLLESNRLDQAREELRLAALLGASEKQVLSRAAELMDVMDMREQADALIANTVHRQPGDFWPREVLVRRLWHGNQLEDADAQLRQAAEDLGGLSVPLQKLQILTHICMRDFPQSMDELRRLESSDQDADDPDAQSTRAWAVAVRAALSSATLKWRDRMERLRNALASCPNDAVLHSLMGDGWAEVGEQSQAVFFYRQAFSLDPQWMAAGISLGNALLASGRLDEAYSVSREVVSRSPRDQLAPLLLYAKSFLALGAAGRGAELVDSSDEIGGDLVDVLTQIRKQRPQNADVAALLAEALCQTNQKDRARDLMHDAMSSGDAGEQMVIALAEVSARHQLEMEIPLLKHAQQFHAANIPLASMLADAQVRNGDPNAGLQVFDLMQNAGSLADNQALALTRARIDFELRNKLNGAMRDLSSALSRYPDTIEIQQLALMYPQAWSDPDLMARAIANLKKLLGDNAPQVRLAEANTLLHDPSRDEAKLAKAMVLIESVLEQSPNSLAALSMMADAASASRSANIDRAIECLEHATGLYTDQPGLVIRLVALLQMRGNFAKAGRYLHSLARFADAGESLKRAELRLWQNQGDVDAAIVRASALVNQDSPVPDQLVLAAIHQQAGHRAEAEQIYQNLLKESPVEPLAISQAAEFYADTGRFDRGFELIASMTVGESADHELRIGSFCRRHDHPQRAREYLERAVAQQPSSTQARLELARLYLQERETAKARDQALAGLRGDPKSQDLRAVLAVAGLNAGGSSRQESIAALREIGGENQDLLATLTLLQSVPADADGGLQPTPENLNEAKQLLEDHGQFWPAWQLTIVMNLAAKQDNEATLIARNAVSRFPGQIEPAQTAVQLLMKDQRWRDALADAQEWRRRSLDDPYEADVAIGAILLQLNRADDAAKQLEMYATQLENNRDRHPENLEIWIRALALSGEFDRAISIVTPLLTRDARWRQVWISLASQLRPPPAQRALALLESVTHDSEEQLNLIGQWIALGEHAECTDCYDRALALARDLEKREPDSAQPLLAQAAVAEARQNWTEAESLYRRILAKNPAQALAMNNLAWVLARTKAGCDEALSLIETALAAQPNQPDFLDTYAHVLLGMDRARDAEAALNKALQLKPNDLAISFTLIETQLLQGHRDGLDERLSELKRQMAVQRTDDPEMQRRFDELSRRVAESQTAAGT